MRPLRCLTRTELKNLGNLALNSSASSSSSSLLSHSFLKCRHTQLMFASRPRVRFVSIKFLYFHWHPFPKCCTWRRQRRVSFPVCFAPERESELSLHFLSTLPLFLAWSSCLHLCLRVRFPDCTLIKITTNEAFSALHLSYPSSELLHCLAADFMSEFYSWAAARLGKRYLRDGNRFAKES